MIKNRKSIFFISFAILFFSISAFMNRSLEKPIIILDKQEIALNFNNKLLAFFSLGHKKLVTDLLWITTLIESDVEHYKKQDLNSWLYLRFKSITTLDPKFLRAYRFGGKYLSIIKDDLEGAEKLMTDGLKVFPNDYQLNYDLGFLYAFESGEHQKALGVFQKIQNHPQAPAYLKSTINKLKYEQSNDLNLAWQIVFDMYSKEANGTPLKRKLHSDLYAIKAELDLKCLNNKKTNCPKVDFLGKPYIYSDGSYTTQFSYKPYKLFRNKKGKQ